VVDLVPPVLSRRDLFPAGRLDRDTTGLLILTDDGELAHRMLSPKKHVYKLYEASVDGPVGAEEIEKFAAGVALEDGTVCLPAGLTVVKQGTAWETLVEIREGKFHQVKKMFLAVGRRVLRLKRVRIGGLELDKTLKEGECRELTKEELALIFQGENRRFCEKKNSNGQI
jgi:16S rRNA pseudouridine516 synthase